MEYLNRVSEFRSSLEKRYPCPCSSKCQARVDQAMRKNDAKIRDLLFFQGLSQSVALLKNPSSLLRPSPSSVRILLWYLHAISWMSMHAGFLLHLLHFSLPYHLHLPVIENYSWVRVGLLESLHFASSLFDPFWRWQSKDSQRRVVERRSLYLVLFLLSLLISTVHSSNSVCS